jgi:hypothetical protein
MTSDGMTPEHFCHCGKPASFGYRVRLLNDIPGEWYCREHRPNPAPVLTVEELKLETPEKFKRKCELCGNDIDLRESDLHQWMSGWVKIRRNESGGVHNIALPMTEDRWVHGYCIRREYKGYAKQFDMFGSK